MTNGLGQRVFNSAPTAEQYLPEEEELGPGFIAWLKSKFRWMFETAQSTASLGTTYVYAEGLPSWVLLGEYDNGGASGTGRTEYIWLPTPDGNVIPIGMRRNGRFYSIHADHLGTPRLVKDDTNTPVWQLPYSAFGNNRPVGVLSTTTTTGYAITPGATPLKATPPAERLNLRFPGQYADSETGEFYNYFRNYDPRTGRYTQADPIGLEGGISRFAYVDNDTLQFADVDGLSKNRGGGNPRSAVPTQANQNGAWSYGQFYPRIGEPLVPRASTRVPDTALVCRGGQCAAQNFTNGSGVTPGPNGTLNGVSTQCRPGATREELSASFKNGQVGFTTAGQIRSAGGRITADGNAGNPNHATVDGLTARQLQELFNPTVPNPTRALP